MPKLKIGLALGSGAARGLAHVGVLHALMENDIKIDLVAGTSIGAVVGSLYCAGLGIEKMEGFAKDFGGRRIAFWMDPTFFRSGGLLKGEKIERSIEDLIGPIDFKDLKTPFCVVATDLISGEEIVISKGKVVSAVRASFSIPGIFAPVWGNGRWLVDGALVAPLPTRILRERGCDIVISSDVGSAPESSEAISERHGPKLFEVLIQALSVAQAKLSEPCVRLADINIEPAIGEFDWTNFAKYSELAEKGYAAAMELMPRIKDLTTGKKPFWKIFTGAMHL